VAASGERLRVAFVAGTLGVGGAEKQMVYMARALCQSGAEVRVLSLTRGDYYERALREIGLEPVWIGQSSHPLGRLAAVIRALREFRPHILQAAHFFTNLYVGLAAPWLGAVSVGAIRSDVLREMKEHGAWGPWLLRLPAVLIANSHAARTAAAHLGTREDKIFILSNAIDLQAFDRLAGQPVPTPARPGGVTAALVANLIPFKRVDRFLEGLATARAQVPGLTGWIIGEGRSRGELEARAADLGLDGEGVTFLGSREDVPALLKQVDLLAVTSDHEGIPNVLLEAMAARLPVITTPTGDAPVIVQHGLTGFVIPYEPREPLVERLVELAGSPDLRRQMGQAGREAVENRYSFDRLGEQLLEIYRQIGRSGQWVVGSRAR